MTLSQWLDSNEVPHSIEDNELWCIIADDIDDTTVRAELWHLADYKVSSVSGGCIWLL